MPFVHAWQEEDLVGPALPPPEGDADEAGDAWDDRGMGEPDEEADPYRLPITSEVALEGAAPLPPYGKFQLTAESSLLS
jgi:hypothetical protein